MGNNFYIVMATVTAAIYHIALAKYILTGDEYSLWCTSSPRHQLCRPHNKYLAAHCHNLQRKRFWINIFCFWAAFYFLIVRHDWTDL